MNRHIRAIALSICIAATTQTIAADKVISLSVRPAVTASRGSARVQVFVERDARNRLLILEVDGPNYYRSSSMPLEAASAPRSWFFLVRDLPEGEYAIRVTVRRNDNSESAAISAITVMPGTP